MSNPVFSYEPIISRALPPLPQGASIAVWPGLNIEHYEWGKPSLSIVPDFKTFMPDPINYGWRDYGARVGFWRLAAMFEELGIRATAICNSAVALEYPPIVAEVRRLNWGLVAHGRTNSVLNATLDPTVERRYLSEMTEELECAFGYRPRGWLGPSRSMSLHTYDILADLGYTHAMDWSNDDQPYFFTAGGGSLVSVPYSLEVNDVLVNVFNGGSGADLERRICDAFDVLREEGRRSPRVLGLSLHPFISGQPFRFKYLRRALEYIARHDDVWWSTSEEIAAWYARDEAAAAHDRQPPRC